MPKTFKPGENAEGSPWASPHEDLETVTRLVRLFGAQVGQLRAEGTERPEHISQIMGRLVEKWKTRQSYKKLYTRNP